LTQNHPIAGGSSNYKPDVGTRIHYIPFHKMEILNPLKQYTRPSNEKMVQ
jgi:hypothetical protein